MTWNIEGLRNAEGNLHIDLFSGYDVVILMETFLTSDWSAQRLYSVHSFAEQSTMGRPKRGISCLLSPRMAKFIVIHKTSNILGVKTPYGIFLGVYFQPELQAVDVIDSLSRAISAVPRSEHLIIAGDLNCRIDQPTGKSMAVLNYLEGEGLTLLSRKEDKTYLCHNGSSTIDIFFSNLKGVKSCKTRTLQSVTIRKHLPTELTLILDSEFTQHSPQKTMISRRLDTDKLQCDLQKLPSILEEIEKGISTEQQRIWRTS